MGPSIESFVEQANRARSTAEVSRLFENALKTLGYDRFCYSLITAHPSAGLNAGHGVVRNYPEDWMSHYQSKQYEKLDPVPLHCLSTGKPFTWDSMMETCQLKAEQKEVMDEAREARLLDGIAIPIYGQNGELAGVGLASSAGGIKPDAVLLSTVRLLSVEFHSVYTELEKKDFDNGEACMKNVRLTDREREILSWAAEGKSDSVISDLIGVSHATVRFHLNNIYRKLNANERTLATVKAIRHGLILPSYLR